MHSRARTLTEEGLNTPLRIGRQRQRAPRRQEDNNRDAQHAGGDQQLTARQRGPTAAPKEAGPPLPLLKRRETPDPFHALP
jgi:hypothetical protein